MAAYLDLGLSITAVNNASRPIQQVSGDVKKLGENAEATANRLKAIQVVIAGILINKSIELGRAFAEMAAKNQTLDIRMAAFAGSAQKAAQIQEELSKKFAASGLVVDDLAQTFIGVRNAVKSNEQGVKLVEAMANAVLALGGNQGNVDNLAESFQKLGGIGTATKRDLTSLVTNTSITLPDLARAAGQTATQFEGNLRNGFLNTQTLIEAFIKATHDKIGAWSEGLKSTIAGSMGYIGNALDDAVGDLGKRTNINVQFAAMFTNIGNAIKNFIGSINQQDVDKFFNVLKDMEPVVTKLIRAIINLGGGVIGLADIIARFIGMLPEAAFEYGIIGYVLFGKKGAVVGALLAGVDQKVRDFGKGVDQFAVDHNIFKGFFAADKAKLDKSTLDALMASFSSDQPRTGKSIFGDPKQIADMQTALDKMIKSAGSFGASNPNGIGYMLEQAIEKAKLLRQEIQDLADQTKGKIDLLNFRTDGDALQEKIQAIKNETHGWIDALEKALLKLQQSKLHVADEAALISQVKQEIEDANKARDRAIEKAAKLNDLTRQGIFLQNEATRNQLRQTAVQLGREKDSGHAFNFVSGTSGGQLQQATDDKLLALDAKVKEYRIAQNDLVTKIQETNDLGVMMDYQRNIDQLETLKTSTEDYMNTLDAGMESNKQLWRDLGQTMEQDLTNGITGLITGTMTLGDVFRQIFTDMIGMGVKFLIQLAEIQLFGQIASQTAVATAAITSAELTAVWGPAAVSASIATMGGADAVGVAAYQAALATSIIPFADGGVPGLSQFSNQVVSGPTMFGMMGEAGNEAIMPLTRIGGKLGVRSDGGGGNSYHITVQALDTQSGLEFVGKHIEYIDARLSHNRVLNNGVR